MSNLMTASHQWATRPADQRFTELADLRASVHSRRTLSKATDLSIRDLHVDLQGMDGSPDERLVLNNKITPSEPTHWSFGQLCTWGKAPAAYLRTLPLPIVKDALNYSIGNAPREALKLMTLRNDSANGINTLQAVTSPTYGRIWDADVVDAVQRIVDKTNGAFTNPLEWSGKKSGLYASDHDVFILMVNGGSIVNAGRDSKGREDILHRGFMVWNSEVGASTFGLMTFYFRFICGNHIIWGATDVNQLLIRHTSGGPARFDTQALPVLASYINQSPAPMEQAIRKAKAWLLPAKMDDLIEQVNKWGKFTRGEIREAVEYATREEGDCRSLWNLVQGFTASARDYQFTDARVELEKRSSKLLAVVS